MMDVSVIIVNYNTRQMTAECIESIFEKTSGIDFEIILVDNASIDGSKEYFEKDNRIKYIYSNENLGFGRANNLGEKYANGKYLFLLNSDTLLFNNAIKNFYDFAESTEINFSCLGCILVDRNDARTHSSGEFPTFRFFIKKYISNYTRRLGRDLTYKYYYSLPAQFPATVDYITGADLFMNREAINRLGMFNSSFFMYFEETEMQKRYNAAGYYSVLIDTPQIKHLCGGSRKKKSLKGWRLDIEGGFVYSKLQFSTAKYFILRLITPIILLPKIIFYPTNIGDKVKSIKTLFKRIDLKELTR